MLHAFLNFTGWKTQIGPLAVNLAYSAATQNLEVKMRQQGLLRSYLTVTVIHLTAIKVVKYYFYDFLGVFQTKILNQLLCNTV